MGDETIFKAAVIAAMLIMPANAGSAEIKTVPTTQVSRDVSKLPTAVQRMRQAILQAAASGDVEQLRVAIDMNEIKPSFGHGPVGDPIAHLKTMSADGNGREMLALLFNIMTTGYAITNPAAKDEMIVWPYHAAIPLAAMTPSQEVDIYRFLPPTRVNEMVAAGKYTHYAVGISKSGVWHYFMKE